MAQMVKGLLDQGREAAQRYAWREAFDLLKAADGEQALGAADLEALAESAWWTGQLDEAIGTRERSYGAHLKEGSPQGAARVALALVFDHSGRQAMAASMAWYNRAERLLEKLPEGVEHGLLAWGQSYFAMGEKHFDAAVAAADRAIDIGTRFGSADVQGFGLVAKGRALVAMGKVSEGVAFVDEAAVAAVSGELGPFAAGIIYCLAITVFQRLGEYQRAGEWTDAARRWCERQSIAGGFPGVCRVHRAEIIRLRGHWQEAEEEVKRAVHELKDFNLWIAAEGYYELGEIRFRIGDLTGAEEAFRQAHELGHDPEPGMAMLRASQGKFDAAAAGLRRCLLEDTVDRIRRARLLPALVEIEIARGELEAARGASEELQQIVAEYDTSTLRAVASQARGAVALAQGDNALAFSSLRNALKTWNDSDLPYEAAQTRVLLAEAYRIDAEQEAAAMELNAARSVFERLGAMLDVQRVDQLLNSQNGSADHARVGLRLTKTFMFTDIVKSTNLVEAIGDEAWEDLLRWHDAMLRSVFESHSGEEIKHAGDGFFVAFDDAGSAVECAIDIQLKLANHRRTHGFAPPVRIGLHAAEATQKGDGRKIDYAGKGVHEASRIAATAGGGEIVASLQTYSDAGAKFQATEPKKVDLKGISHPVEVVAISWR